MFMAYYGGIERRVVLAPLCPGEAVHIDWKPAWLHFLETIMGYALRDEYRCTSADYRPWPEDLRYELFDAAAGRRRWINRHSPSRSDMRF